LRGRLEPTPTGTRIDGRISRYLPLMWFGAAFLVLAAVAFLYLVAVSLAEAFTGGLTDGEVAGCLVQCRTRRSAQCRTRRSAAA
jgi:hypothetical protein